MAVGRRRPDGSRVLTVRGDVEDTAIHKAVDEAGYAIA